MAEDTGRQYCLCIFNEDIAIASDSLTDLTGEGCIVTYIERTRDYPLRHIETTNGPLTFSRKLSIDDSTLM